MDNSAYRFRPHPKWQNFDPATGTSQIKSDDVNIELNRLNYVLIVGQGDLHDVRRKPLRPLP